MKYTLKKETKRAETARVLKLMSKLDINELEYDLTPIENKEEEDPLYSGLDEIDVDKINVYKAKKRGYRNGFPPFLWHWNMPRYANKANPKGGVSLDLMDILHELNEEMDFTFFNSDNFDSEGVWGLSRRHVEMAWFKSGVGQAPGYFKNIIRALLIILKRKGRLDYDVNVFILPKKFLTISQILDIWETYIKLDGIHISSKLMLKIINFSYIRREIIIKKIISLNENYLKDSIFYEPDERQPYTDYRRLPIIGMKNIDWKYLSSPLFKLVKDRAIDNAYRWFWYTKKLGLELNLKPSFLREFGNPFEFNKKQLQFFVENCNVDDDHYNIGLKNLINICGNDSNAARKIMNNTNIGSTFTFNIDDFSKNIKSELKVLILKDTRFIEMIGNYPVIREEIGEIPVSYEAAEKIQRSLQYDNIISVTVAREAAKTGLSQNLFEKVQKRHLKNVEYSTKFKGQFTSLPENISVKSEGYNVYVLPKTDPRGLFLGKITNCCQTIGDIGGECAKAGSRDGDKGFLIIEKDGVIVAQSWIWVDNKGNLVLDSIESKGLSEVQLDRVSVAIKDWSLKAKETIFINKIFIGKTSYGITKDIRKRLELSDKDYSNDIQQYNGYMDGRVQRKIID